MTATAGPSWTAAILRALAGAPAGAAPPEPPAWTAQGSRFADLLARSRPVPLAAAGDGVVAALRGRPLLWLAALAAGAPLARLLLPPGPALGAVLLLLASAGMALLLAAAARLHDGDAGLLLGRVLLAALLLRVLLAAAIQAAGGFPDEHGYYHPLAADAAGCWQAGGPSVLAEHPVVRGRAAYFYGLAGAYALFGADMVVGRLLGVLVGLASALAAGEVARALAGPRAAVLAAAILALHPEHAFWNGTLSRDGLATLLVLLALAAHLRRPGTLLRGNAIVVAVPVLLLALNSFLVAGSLAAALLLAAGAEALVLGRPGPGRVLRTAAALALGGAALAYVGWRYGNLFHPGMFSAVRNQPIGTVPDFLPGLRFEGLADVALYLPLGSAFVLFSPWPWDAVHAHRAAYGVLAAAGFAVTVAGIAGLGRAARRNPGAASVPVVYGLLYLSLLALLEGTSGIVLRHRLPLTALLAVGAGVLLAGMRRPAAA